MKALLFETFGGPLAVVDVPEPTLPRDGVVIRVGATGICRSDWHGWQGHDSDVRVPHVPGHELAGVIEAAGPEVHGWNVGDRVTTPFAVGCGRCAECLSGNQQVCERYYQPGFTGWGACAELVAVPHADVNLVRLADGMDFVEAASLGCRFATSFRAVVAQGRVCPGQWVAVHGCGGVGLAAVMIAAAAGARVIAIDIRDEALALAREIGAAHALHARVTGDIVDAVRALSGGGAHVSLDALGSRDTCRNSIRCLRRRGRHVQVGLMVADYKDALVPMHEVIAKELVLLGSHGMQAHEYAPMLAMIAAGALAPRRLVRKTVSLAQAGNELAGMGNFNALGVTVIDRMDA